MFLWRFTCDYFLILFFFSIWRVLYGGKNVKFKKLKFYIVYVCVCLCMCVCVFMTLCIWYVCASVYLCVCPSVYVYTCVSVPVSVCVPVSTSSILCAGPSECFCGKSSLLDTCRTLAKATRRFWSLSPVEDGWTHLRTAPGLCTTLLGISTSY